VSGMPVPLAQRLLYHLAGDIDARGTAAGFVSGAALAGALGVSRAAIWKAASRLRELGVSVEALPRRGYRLGTPCSSLSAERLRALLPADLQRRLHEIDVCWQTGSTNADLLARPPSFGKFSLRLAEHQTAGRGRRGRNWLAAPGGALCLSWSWRFETLPSHIASLGLAIGVGVVEALEALGLAGAGLKWPNDIVTSRGKLAGILIELVSEAAGPALVVIGIGMNVALGSEVRESVRAQGNDATDVRALAMDAGLATPDRNRLAAMLVAHGIDRLLRWESDGFAETLPAWTRLDRLRDHEVVVRDVRGSLRGIARGVDMDGALLVDDGSQVHRCVSGEASVRLDEREHR
jgi:BirA family transcriptional regulator, biotin operon repressor / biotin---[acetyl-CoA-carboxylase] ligase